MILCIVQAQKQTVVRMQVKFNSLSEKFNRQEELFDRGSLSLLAYEESQNDLKIAESELLQAQAYLEIAQYRLGHTKFMGLPILSLFRAMFDLACKFCLTCKASRCLFLRKKESMVLVSQCLTNNGRISRKPMYTKFKLKVSSTLAGLSFLV